MPGIVSDLMREKDETRAYLAVSCGGFHCAFVTDYCRRYFLSQLRLNVWSEERRKTSAYHEYSHLGPSQSRAFRWGNRHWFSTSLLEYRR